MIEKNEIWKIYGPDYKEMTVRLLEAANLAALIGNRDLRIGIKPNLLAPTPAEYGATTHPEVVAGIIEYLQAEGFRNIIMAEGSWVGDRTSEAYEYCGYSELSEKYGVPFVDTQKENWHSVECAGMKLNIVDVADSIDFLINVPVLKGHCQTKMTCALKNMKGLLPNQEKSRFHRLGLHKPIAHLQTAIRQDFIVVDHICGDLDFEEGGNPVIRNCIMAALDPVLVDSYACWLLHYTPDDVPYVRMAEQLGIGSTDLSAARIVRLANTGNEPAGIMESDADSTEFDTESLSFDEAGQEEELPRAQKLLEVSYAVEDADSCSACYANLTGALWRLREEGLLEMLKEPIGIGQGMQGKTGRLGIGRCTKDFDHSIGGCPPDEEKIYRELKAYILQISEI